MNHYRKRALLSTENLKNGSPTFPATTYEKDSYSLSSSKASIISTRGMSFSVPTSKGHNNVGGVFGHFFHFSFILLCFVFAIGDLGHDV